MKRAIVAAVVLAGLVVASRCDLFRDDESGPKPVPFRSVTAAADLTVETAGTAVFRDDAAWSSFWVAHSTAPVPAIDFSRETLVAVFWGRATCIKLAQAIERVERRDGVIEVTVGPLPPLLGADCPASETTLEVVAIPASALPVRFVGDVPQ